MTSTENSPAPLEILHRLNDAMNRHDLRAFIACFDEDYDSAQPAHPGRRFRGRAQVQKNWAAMFTGLPDLRADIVASVASDDSFWVEWRWTGTRADGSKLLARGVGIFGVRGGLVVWGRLYMEDVEGDEDIEAAVKSLTG